jgi:bacterioferritin-associated ferredoxin
MAWNFRTPMIICSCNVVSDAMVRATLDPQCAACPRTPGAVFKRLGCSPNCGRCFVTVRKILIELLGAHSHHHLHGPACDGACETKAAPPVLAANL